MSKLINVLGGILFGAVILFFVGLIVLIFVALGMDFYKTMSHGTGWVYQGKHGTAMKTFIKEENGCVYYVDVWDNNTKTCGAYELKLYKN